MFYLQRGALAGAASEAAELRKHTANVAQSAELGFLFLLWWIRMGYGVMRLNSAFPDLHLTLLSMAVCNL